MTNLKGNNIRKWWKHTKQLLGHWVLHDLCSLISEPVCDILTAPLEWATLQTYEKCGYSVTRENSNH